MKVKLFILFLFLVSFMNLVNANEGYGDPKPYTLSCGATGTIFIPYGSIQDYANRLMEMEVEQCSEEDAVQLDDEDQE